MISRTTFNNIEKGNYILFSSGVVRKVVEVKQHFGRRVRIKPRTYLVFEKIKGFGTTIYLYGDLKHRIKGIFRIKSGM